MTVGSGTATDTPFVTPTVVPSATQRPVPSPTIPEATPTATPTPFPTFTAEEAQRLSSSSLITNGGCLLPCWWGIQPGTSDRQDAVNAVLPWPQSSATSSIATTGFFVPDVNTPSGYNVSTSFMIRHDVVSSIKVDMEVNGQARKYPYSTRDWRALAWGRILGTYGVPDQVSFNPGTPPPERDAPMLYSLVLVYKAKGFAIGY
jgi:hypothetical protein